MNSNPHVHNYAAANPSTNTHGSGPQESKHSDNPDDDSRFVCNICLDSVRDPVVTVCGHLYCWPCLFRWLNTAHTTCPVCKAGVTQENVIPLYIRGSEQDPRTKDLASGDVPNRPGAQRPEPQQPHNPHAHPFAGANANPNPFLNPHMSFSAGIGFFPSLFGLQFQSFTQPTRPPTGQAVSPEEAQQAFLSRLLLMLGSLVILCLLLF